LQKQFCAESQGGPWDADLCGNLNRRKSLMDGDVRPGSWAANETP
jgi:hypothetical protein